MNCRSLLLGTLALFLAPIALAANWPERTVRIIIPWPPGGSTDIVGRLLAAELTGRQMSTAEFGKLMVSEHNKWLDVI